jgi:hypothetical protein
MPNYNKLSVVVSLILLCLALSLIVVLPTRTFSFVVLGSPLTIRISQNWVVAALLGGMACSGTASVIRLHPLSRREKRTFVSCILPSLAVLLAAILLPRTPNRIYNLGGLAVMGILLPLIIIAEYRIIDPAAPDHRAIRLGLNFIAYLLALVLFALIHDSKADTSPEPCTELCRSISTGFLSAATALVGSGLLALDVLHGPRQSLRQTGLYALIVGLVMGEIAWTLSYWQVNSLTAGILLLLIFYIVTGLARQGLSGLLSRRILIEFAVVALIGLALLLKYGP